MGRVAVNKEYTWKCGRCGFEVFYKEEAPAKCPNCDYIHGQRNYLDVPETVKLKIHR